MTPYYEHAGITIPPPRKDRMGRLAGRAEQASYRQHAAANTGPRRNCGKGAATDPLAITNAMRANWGLVRHF